MESPFYARDDEVNPAAIDGTKIAKPWHRHFGGSTPIAFELAKGTHTVLLAMKMVDSTHWGLVGEATSAVTLNAAPGKAYIVVGRQAGTEYVMWIEDAATHEVCSARVSTAGMNLPKERGDHGGGLELAGAIASGAAMASSARALDDSLAGNAPAAQVLQNAANLSAAVAPDSQLGPALQADATLAASLNGFNNAVRGNGSAAELLQAAAGASAAIAPESQTSLALQQSAALAKGVNSTLTAPGKGGAAGTSAATAGGNRVNQAQLYQYFLQTVEGAASAMHDASRAGLTPQQYLNQAGSGIPPGDAFTKGLWSIEKNGLLAGEPSPQIASALVQYYNKFHGAAAGSPPVADAGIVPVASPGPPLVTSGPDAPANRQNEPDEYINIHGGALVKSGEYWHASFETKSREVPVTINYSSDDASQYAECMTFFITMNAAGFQTFLNHWPVKGGIASVPISGEDAFISGRGGQPVSTVLYPGLHYVVVTNLKQGEKIHWLDYHFKYSIVSTKPAQ